MADNQPLTSSEITKRLHDYQMGVKPGTEQSEEDLNIQFPWDKAQDAVANGETPKPSIGQQTVAALREGVEPMNGFQNVDSALAADLKNREERINYYPGQDIEQSRAANQSWGEQVLHGAIKMGTTAAATTVNEIAGIPFGIGSALFSLGSDALKAARGESTNGNVLLNAVDAGVNNWVSQKMVQMQDAMEEIAPNYYTQEERSEQYQREWYKPSHWFTGNNLGDNILKNFGFTLGAIGGGAGISKALGKAASRKMAGNILKGATLVGEKDEAAAQQMRNVAAALKRGTLTGLDVEKVNSNLTDIAKMINKKNAEIQWLSAGLSAMAEGNVEGLMAGQEFNDEQHDRLRQMRAEELASVQSSLMSENNDRYTDVQVVQNADGSTSNVPILTDDGVAEMQRRQKAINEKYDALESDVDSQSRRIASVVFALNIPILTASNTVQFGKLLGGGWKTQRRALAGNARFSAGKIASNVKPKGSVAQRTIADALKVTFSEGGEEMAQGVISSGRKQVGVDTIDSRIASYNNDAYDEDATNRFRGYLSGFLYGSNDYLSDVKNWQEGALGALTGLFGIPGKRWNGGVIGAYQTAKQEYKADKEAANKLNSLVKSEDFRNRWDGYIRYLKYQNEADAALENDDEYAWHTAENKKIINDIITFSDTGQLGALRDMVDANLSLTDGQAQSIKSAMQQQVRDKKITGPDAAFWNNADLPAIKDRIKDRAQELRKMIDTYSEMYDALSTRAPMGTSPEFLKELVFTATEMKAFEDRFLSMFDSTMETVNAVLDADKSLADARKAGDTEAEKNVRSELDDLRNRYERIYGSLFLDNRGIAGKVEDELLEILEANTAKIRDKATVKKLQDMRKVAAARRQLFAKLQLLLDIKSSEGEANTKTADTNGKAKTGDNTKQPPKANNNNGQQTKADTGAETQEGQTQKQQQKGERRGLFDGMTPKKASGEQQGAQANPQQGVQTDEQKASTSAEQKVSTSEEQRQQNPAASQQKAQQTGQQKFESERITPEQVEDEADKAGARLMVSQVKSVHDATKMYLDTGEELRDNLIDTYREVADENEPIKKFLEKYDAFQQIMQDYPKADSNNSDAEQLESEATEAMLAVLFENADSLDEMLDAPERILPNRDEFTRQNGAVFADDPSVIYDNALAAAKNVMNRYRQSSGAAAKAAQTAVQQTGQSTAPQAPQTQAEQAGPDPVAPSAPASQPKAAPAQQKEGEAKQAAQAPDFATVSSRIHDTLKSKGFIDLTTQPVNELLKHEVGAFGYRTTIEKTGGKITSVRVQFWQVGVDKDGKKVLRDEIPSKVPASKLGLTEEQIANEGIDPGNFTMHVASVKRDGSVVFYVRSGNRTFPAAYSSWEKVFPQISKTLTKEDAENLTAHPAAEATDRSQSGEIEVDYLNIYDMQDITDEQDNDDAQEEYESDVEMATAPLDSEDPIPYYRTSVPEVDSEQASIARSERRDGTPAAERQADLTDFYMEGKNEEYRKTWTALADKHAFENTANAKVGAAVRFTIDPHFPPYNNEPQILVEVQKDDGSWGVASTLSMQEKQYAGLKELRKAIMDEYEAFIKDHNGEKFVFSKQSKVLATLGGVMNNTTLHSLASTRGYDYNAGIEVYTDSGRGGSYMYYSVSRNGREYRIPVTTRVFDMNAVTADSREFTTIRNLITRMTSVIRTTTTENYKQKDAELREVLKELGKHLDLRHDHFKIGMINGAVYFTWNSDEKINENWLQRHPDVVSHDKTGNVTVYGRKLDTFTDEDGNETTRPGGLMRSPGQVNQVQLLAFFANLRRHVNVRFGIKENGSVSDETQSRIRELQDDDMFLTRADTLYMKGSDIWYASFKPESGDFTLSQQDTDILAKSVAFSKDATEEAEQYAEDTYGERKERHLAQAREDAKALFDEYDLLMDVAPIAVQNFVIDELAYNYGKMAGATASKRQKQRLASVIKVYRDLPRVEDYPDSSKRLGELARDNSVDVDRLKAADARLVADLLNAANEYGRKTPSTMGLAGQLRGEAREALLSIAERDNAWIEGINPAESGPRKVAQRRGRTLNDDFRNLSNDEVEEALRAAARRTREGRASEEQRRTEIQNTVSEFERTSGVTVTVYSSYDEIPDTSDREYAVRNNTAGWYRRSSGRIELIMPNIQDAAAAQRVLLHEAVGHMGLRGIMSEKEHTRIMDAVWNDLMDEAARAQFLQYVDNAHTGFRDEDERRRTAVDEYIAHVAESGIDEHISFWKRLATHVKLALQRLGIKSKLSERDLAVLLHDSYRRLGRTQRSLRRIDELRKKREAGEQVVLEQFMREIPELIDDHEPFFERWDDLTEAHQEVLQMRGITKEVYESLSIEARKKLLGCM